MATITVFLSDAKEGGELIYPSTKGKPVRIRPRKGMAVVHHNVDENRQFEAAAVSALFPVGEGELYVARKYVFPIEQSFVKRMLLPAYSAPFGGVLPSILVQLYDTLEERFADSGEDYFEKACYLVPVLIVLAILQISFMFLKRQLESTKDRSKQD